MVSSTTMVSSAIMALPVKTKLSIEKSQFEISSCAVKFLDTLGGKEKKIQKISKCIYYTLYI